MTTIAFEIDSYPNKISTSLLECQQNTSMRFLYIAHIQQTSHRRPTDKRSNLVQSTLQELSYIRLIVGNKTRAGILNRLTRETHTPRVLRRSD